MATAAQLMYGVAVEDRASGPLNAIAGAADRAGTAAEAMETRVRRGATTFAEAAGRLDAVEKATTRVEQATARVTRTMEAAEAAARAEGVAHDRLNAVLVSGAQAREQAALAAVRGFTAEQQAAALTRAGYANLAAQVQATAQAQSNLGVRAASGLAAANDNVTSSSSRMSTVLGQAGFQVQDFATQVSMGQNALMAFGVQGAQLAGIFGPAGAIAGAGLMIGVIAAQLMLGKTAADAFADSMRRQADALTDLEADARRYREGIADEARQVRELTEYYGALSQARQSQEMRQFRRDQADLEGAQSSLRNDALGSASGLSRAFQSQLADVQMQAAASYGRGSTEFNLIVSNPDLQRMRDFVAVVEGFRETGDVSREALARLYQQMLGLADGSDVVSRRIREQATTIDGLTGRAREAEVAQAQLAARAAALGLNVDSAATATDRLNRQLESLRRYDENIGAGLSREIGDLQRELAAAAVGANRLREVRGQLSRERRLDEMVSDRQKELERQGITGDAATTSLAEFRTQTEATLDRIGRLRDGVRTLEDGFRSAAPAIRDAADAYGELRRDAGTGLLLGSDADARMAREISGQLRGTLQERRQAEQEAQRQATRAAEQLERQNQQVTDSIVRYGADRFADMFAENSRGWVGMLDTFRSTFRSLMARIAAEAIIRPIIAPIVQGLGLGQMGGSGGFSLSGIFGGGGGAVADLGSTQGAINQASQSAGLFSFGRSTGLGGAFTGGTANSGFGWLDGTLNSQLMAPVSFPSEAAFQGLVNGTAPSGLSLGGALGGAAGIAGGAYGIYSGLNRGGIGGYTSAAGGALGVASGISSILASLGVISAGLGPIGWIGAAVLAIAGALLPGQKPSSMGQEARLELNSGALSTRGLTGDRYSAANATQAEAAVRSISDLASRLSAALGGLSLGDQAAAVGVTRSTLYLDAVGQKAQFANSEEGAKQLADTAARFLLDAFTEAEKRAVAARGAAGSDQLGILINSGGSVETLQQNLAWYEGTFKALTQTAEKTTQWAETLKSTAAPFDAAIEKARQLGVMEGALTAKRAEALAKLEEERNATIGRADASLTARWFRAVGMDQNADLISFDDAAANEIRQAREAWEQLGLSSEAVAAKIARNEQVLATERLAIVNRYAEEARALEQQAAAERAQRLQAGAGGALGTVTNLRDYLTGLATTEAGAGTALDRYGASQRQFDAVFGAAAAGDARSISGLRDAAEAYRINARDVFGGGAGYAEALRLITDRIGNVAGLGADALTQSFMIENARENTDRVVDQLAALRRDINLLLARPMAA